VRDILNHDVPFYAFDRVEKRSMSSGALRWIGSVYTYNARVIEY
jgi:hypothetical protein